MTQCKGVEQQTEKRVANQNKNVLHGIDALNLLEQGEIEQRILRSVCDENRLDLCPWLSIHTLDEC